MDTNTHELILKEEVFQVVGCAMEVLNTLGHGLLEKPYEKAQILNYLKITGLRVGIILNFKHAKLEWQRIVL